MEVGCKILYKEEKAFEEYSSQRRLAMHLGDKPQVLCIVFQEEIHPITELTTAADLQEAFRGIFKCYRWLYEKAGIMHRDISLNTLLYRRINGQVHGVLNDFDLSVFQDDAHLSTLHLRTGTKPYMALDPLVLGPPSPHLYRFDLESLFYVFVHIVCQYHDGKKNDKPPFDAWDHLSTRALGDKKWRFIMSPTNVSPTPKFLTFQLLILRLYMFRKGINARVDAALEDRERRLLGLPLTEFDKATLGGHITFEKFEEILCNG
ncbi:hypothetical protein C8F01DRAFT_660788 [Mycena amicta]|nr:hypothetical protein C8F01DRAFT_660788 [Mycena amicta]